MSKVSVSNGSPPLERVDARLSDSPKPAVCRSLFGCSNHEESRRDMQKHMREMHKVYAERWNFDFAEDEPLPGGNCEWQKVDAKEIPEFYTRPPHLKRRSVDHNGNHDYSLTAPSVESGAGDSESTDSGNRPDCRTALTTPKKRLSTDHHDTPRRIKKPKVQTTEAKPSPEMTHAHEHAPRETDPNT